MSQPSQQASATTQTQTQAQTVEQVQHLERLLNDMLDKAERHRGEINLTPGGIEFGNFEGMVRWAKYIQASGLAPKGIDTWEKVLICIVMGRTVGLDPFQAVQNIAPINGRPTLWGDAPLAICRQHKDWVESGFEEYFEVDGKRIDGAPDSTAWKSPSFAAVCLTQRKGAKGQKMSRFSVSHATAAGLMGKGGNLYSGYLQRMLMFRARGYCLRDNFGDALKGIGIQELADDEAPPAPPKPPPTGYQHLGNGNGAARPPDTMPDEPSSPSASTAPSAPVEPEQVGQQHPEQPQAETTEPEAIEKDAMVADLTEQINAGGTIAELDETRDGMEQNREWLGPTRYAALLERYDARFKAIKAPGRRTSSTK